MIYAGFITAYVVSAGLVIGWFWMAPRDPKPRVRIVR